MRLRVLSAARAAAEGPLGAYTLTVPTGGGKTLTALAFALDHAIRHGLRRVIVVVPYTSIIEQTAKTYREAFGDDAVLEHHTNVDADRNRRATGWPARTGRADCSYYECAVLRQLIWQSALTLPKVASDREDVVVLDEVQTLPVGLLAAVRSALSELIEHFDVSELLCTATQPVLIEEAREI